jgi:hypothetical protein
MLCVCFALGTPVFADEAVLRILESDLPVYEKYLPVEDYIKLCTVRDTFLYAAKNDSGLHRHLLAATEQEIFRFRDVFMANLRARIHRVDQKLAELNKNPGSRKKEINALNVQYAGYKKNIAVSPGADTVMDEIETLYSELILRKSYVPHENRTFYTVQKGECLTRIAAYDFVYGDWKKWKLIYEANKRALPNPANPDLIWTGMRLSIPRE